MYNRSYLSLYLIGFWLSCFILALISCVITFYKLFLSYFFLIYFQSIQYFISQILKTFDKWLNKTLLFWYHFSPEICWLVLNSLLEIVFNVLLNRTIFQMTPNISIKFFMTKGQMALVWIAQVQMKTAHENILESLTYFSILLCVLSNPNYNKS